MALITKVQLKNLIGMKADDASQDMRLDFYIDAASSAIESITGRSFTKRTYIETVSGTGSNKILPMHYPIISLDGFNAAYDHGTSTQISLLNFGDYYGVGENQTEIIAYQGTFARGKNNIQYTYTAGYEVIPSDIQTATAFLAEWYYQMGKNGDVGRSSKGKGDESVSLSTSIPPFIREMIQSYKRYEVPNVYQSVQVLG